MFDNYIPMESPCSYSSSSHSLPSSEDDDTNFEAKTDAKRILRNRLISLLSTFVNGPCNRVPASTSSLTGSLFIQEPEWFIYYML
ncbi:hypothetical protein ACOSQ2_023272 [Xanthoceras sorbifolium]